MTLAIYFKSLQVLPQKMQTEYRDKLKIHLQVIPKFSEAYANFLALNLHHLNDTSVELLETLDNNTYLAVRCSTICLVNNAKEMKYFKLLVSGLKYTATTRLNVFEDAIRLT